MERNFSSILVLSLLPVFLFLASGCGDDGPTEPAGPLTTEEVLAKIDTAVGSLDEISAECSALFLLDGEKSEAAIVWLTWVMSQILDDTLDVSLSDFYGTWEDTTLAGDFDGVVRVDSLPADAFRLNLVGRDSLDNPIEGNLIITALEVTVNLLARTVTISASLSLNVDDSDDDASFSLTATVPLDLLDDGKPEGGKSIAGDLPEISLTTSGNICGLSYSLTMETSDEGQFELSGYYAFGGDQVNYSMVTNLTETDTCATFALWTGTDRDDADFLMNSTACNSDVDCLTGVVEIDGVEEATIFAEDCSSDSTDVFVNIDGQVYDGEEIFDALSDLLENLMEGDRGFVAGGGFLAGPSAQRRGIPRLLAENPGSILMRAFVASAPWRSI